METGKKEEIVKILNDERCYKIDLTLWYEYNKNLSFLKEDNDIWKYVNLRNISRNNIDKLIEFFRLIPNANYMYYYDEDCLLSKMIKEKKAHLTYDLIKENKIDHQGLISNTNEINNNVLHIVLKNVNYVDDFMDILIPITEIIKISTNKEKLFLAKDENGKTFVEYFITNMKNYCHMYDDIKSDGYKLSHEIFKDSKEIFSKINIDYIKELFPCFRWYIYTYGDHNGLEKDLLEITSLQEKNKIRSNIKINDISIKSVKKRI